MAFIKVTNPRNPAQGTWLNTDKIVSVESSVNGSFLITDVNDQVHKADRQSVEFAIAEPAPTLLTETPEPVKTDSKSKKGASVATSA